MEDEIVALLKAYQVAQEEYTKARENYRVRWSDVYLAAESIKPDAARKAKADLSTSEQRIERDLAEITAWVAGQRFLIARGPLDNATLPGQKYDHY